MRGKGTFPNGERCDGRGQEQDNWSLDEGGGRKGERHKDHRHGGRRKRLQVAIMRVAQVRLLLPNGDFGLMLTPRPAVGEGGTPKCAVL